VKAMNRRGFLVSLPALAVGTTRYFDIGGSWRKHGSLFIAPEPVLLSPSMYSYLTRGNIRLFDPVGQISEQFLLMER
jgi:hypothetical protein